MTVCLSFAGVAGNFPFQVGASKILTRLIHKYKPEATIVYAGLSSGSVVASMLALGFGVDQTLAHFTRFTAFFDRFYKTPVTSWFFYMRKIYKEFLTPDAYQSVSGKLFIGYSVLTIRGLEERVVSSFTSNDDLIDAIFTSCHIMPYKRLPFTLYRGEICCDGAFSSNLIRLPGVITLGITTSMVHSCVFWSDWLPSVSIIKTNRLYDSGECFVLRNLNYFTALLKGNNKRVLVLEPAFNPLKKRNWIYGIILLYLFYRLYLIKDRTNWLVTFRLLKLQLTIYYTKFFNLVKDPSTVQLLEVYSY